MESREDGRRRMIGIFSLLLLLVGLGTLAGLVLFSSENGRVEIVKDEGQGLRVEGGTETEIVVDVAGKVEKPGVYRLKQGSRIVDALAAAGGLSVKADRDFLSRTINLSQLVTDGMKIYIQEVGDKGGKGDKGENGGGVKILYINSASKEELESLWGVGEARAEAIIAGRPYSSIDELVLRKIVPKNVVEKNKGRLGL